MCAVGFAAPVHCPGIINDIRVLNPLTSLSWLALTYIGKTLNFLTGALHNEAFPRGFL
jgi:hypothetical protein